MYKENTERVFATWWVIFRLFFKKTSISNIKIQSMGIHFDFYISANYLLKVVSGKIFEKYLNMERPVVFFM